MATVTGNKVKYLNNPNLNAVEYYAQVVYSVSYPNATSAKVSWTLRMKHGGSLYDSINRAGCSGDLKSTTTFGAKQYSSSSGQTVNYASGTKTISRASTTKTYDQTFWIENLAENSQVIQGGARSTAKATFTIAARPVQQAPDTPSAPSVSSISQSGCKVNIRLPDNNGATIIETDFRLYTTSTGSTYLNDGKTTTGASTTFDNLNPATDYWAAGAVKNSAGWSNYSARRKFTTDDQVAPSAPAAPVISSITATGFTATTPVPATHGSSITGYHHQISSTSNMQSLIVNKLQASRVIVASDQAAGDDLWVQSRVDSAAGYSGWSPVVPVSLDTSAPKKPLPPVLRSSSDTKAFLELPPTTPQGSAILGYRLQVSSSDGYGSLLHDSTNLELSRTVIGLALGIDYYARQAADSVDGPSAWSNSLVFQTGTGGNGPYIGGDDNQWHETELWFGGDDNQWHTAELWVGENDNTWGLVG